MTEMAVVYLNETNHVLAAAYPSSSIPDLGSLLGRGGLPISGVRGMVPEPATISEPTYHAKVTRKENFLIPPGQLAVKMLPYEPSALLQPHAFLADTTTVVRLPTTGNRYDVKLTPQDVQILPPTPGFGGVVVMRTPYDARVYLQVEGPGTVDRRVMRGMIKHLTDGPYHFPLTVEPGGALAPIATGKTYFVLMIIEGLLPDARTISI